MPPPQQQFHRAAAPARSAWDSNNVAYVGMEYSNMGACSQKAQASFHPSQNAGGCSQNKKASLDPTSAGKNLGGDSGGGVSTFAGPAREFIHTVSDPPRPEVLCAVSPASLPPSVSAPRPADNCQVEGCAEVVLRIGGMSRGVLCASHLRDGMQRVVHNDRIYGTHCSSLNPADITSPIYDTQCKTEPGTTCAFLVAKQELTSMSSFPREELNMKPDNSGSGVFASSSRGKCEHPGCSKTSRYGYTDAPLTLCQSHKRAGMYTIRDGRVLVSTRDGKAILKMTSPPAGAAGTSPVHAATPRAPKSKLERIDSAISSTGPQPTNRKLCEVKGCQVQPSYGPPGTSRPRFCCEHKSEGMVGLKNRPCLSPGCTTRPHYGLTQGRAVYCVSHKKADMVYLLKEAITMEKDRTARNRDLSRKALAERKRRQKAAVASSNAASEKNTLDDGDEEWAAASCKGRSKSKARTFSSTKGRRVGKKVRSRGASSAQSLAARSSLWASSSWSPDEDGAPSDKPSDEDSTSRRVPRCSRFVDVAGIMAPSVEIRLLQQARESARAVAEASGSGRRARAPSRKLLEASGALDNNNSQWRVKATKKADIKVNKELRDQRKHSKVVGLQAGEVMEAFSGPPADVGGYIGRNGFEGDSSSGGSGDGARRDLSSKHGCQELRQAPGQQQQQQQQQQHLHAVGTSVAIPTTISAKEEPVEALSPAPATKFSMKRTWVVRKGVSTSRDGGGGVGKGGSATTEGGVAQPKPKRSRDDRGLALGANSATGTGKAWRGVGEERAQNGKSGGLPKCECGDCPKMATFGVNGTVRYCKSHRLFGMHEILHSR